MAITPTIRKTHRKIRAERIETDVLDVTAFKQNSNVVFRGTAAAAEITTAGAGTYTAANILTGTIVRDCTGASRTDTLSTAALLVAALAAAFGVAPAIGDIVDFVVVNASDPTTEIITIAGGTGGTFAAAQTDVSKTILGTSSRRVRLRLTGVASGAESYVVYL